MNNLAIILAGDRGYHLERAAQGIGSVFQESLLNVTFSPDFEWIAEVQSDGKRVQVGISDCLEYPNEAWMEPLQASAP